jgi:hypothetical protein
MPRDPILIAPPGTPVDGDGWREPDPGFTLRWSMGGDRPDVAVKRGDVLLATGLPPLVLPEPDWDDPDFRRRRREWNARSED